MSQAWPLTSETEWDMFSRHRANLVLAGKRPKAQILDEARTLSQNDMINALYRQIAGQKDDETFNDIRRHCKAYYGIPILLEHDEAFAKMYLNGIMHHLTTEEKLEAMDILPVTSRMKKPQSTEYIETVIREYSKQGISLTLPGEEP